MEVERTRESEPESSERVRKKTLSREDLMERASEVINLLHGRTTATVFRARQDDQARLSYARATTQAIAAYAGLLKDSELEEVCRRLDEIEARGEAI